MNDTDIGHLRREMELCRREKQLMEREIQLMQRENELLRRTQNMSIDGGEREDSVTARSPAIHETGVSNINAIAGLLGYFEGDRARSRLGKDASDP